MCQSSYVTFLEFKHKNGPTTVSGFICPCEALELFQFEADYKNLDFISSVHVLYKIGLYQLRCGNLLFWGLENETR